MTSVPVVGIKKDFVGVIGTINMNIPVEATCSLPYGSRIKYNDEIYLKCAADDLDHYVKNTWFNINTGLGLLFFEFGDIKEVELIKGEVWENKCLACGKLYYVDYSEPQVTCNENKCYDVQRELDYWDSFLIRRDCITDEQIEIMKKMVHTDVTSKMVPCESGHGKSRKWFINDEQIKCEIFEDMKWNHLVKYVRTDENNPQSITYILTDNSITYLEELSKIPKGIYCYDEKGKCPHWCMRIDKPIQDNGHCAFLNRGDWHCPDLSILWDQCKECGINMGDN